MRKLRVMMLVHTSLVPPEDLVDEDDPRMDEYQTEFDVKSTLLDLGHSVKVVGVYDNLAPIRQTIDEWKPHIAFNLLEDFAGQGDLDHYVVSYLDMMGVPYTGCNPRGLVLARDKALSKKLLTYHRIHVPNFAVFPIGRKFRTSRHLRYPMIVKSLMEEGSVGIAQASYVENEGQLHERVDLIHDKTGGDAIAEQYIDGRELYVTVVGNAKLDVYPIRELVFRKVDAGLPRMATYRVKWDYEYRERWGIDYQFAGNLPAGMSDRIPKLCKRVYRILGLSGYARFDFRLDAQGQVFVLEANPNPAIAHNEDCALAAEKAGLDYSRFIQRILNLGLAARRVTG
ncbi:MAG: D-alanine--D-alanine ligase [Gammaproteobacteria bacterium]|nr:MAG: D-alanine--D-alanine ligase [Gammaproteobacteria bacterium]